MHLSRILLLLFLGTSPLIAQNSIPMVAVSDLGAAGLAASDALVISDQLRSELLGTGAFRVIERGQMEQVLKEQGFQQSGCTSDACAVEAGQLLGVKFIVVGSLGMAGSYTILSSRIIDVSTGEITINRTIKNKGGVDAMIEKGTADMAKALAEDFAIKTGQKKDPSVAKKAAEERKAADNAAAAGIEQARRDSLQQVDMARAGEDRRAADAAKAERERIASEKAQKKAATASVGNKKSRGPLVAALVGGGVLVAGGAAAVVLLGGKKDASSSSPAATDGTLRLNLQ